MASPLTAYANSYGADGALGAWTNPAYVYSDDGTNYATRAGTTKNVWYGNLFGFDLSGVPDTAALSSVVLEAQWHNSANDAAGPVLLLGYCTDGSTVVASSSDTSGTTSDEVLSHTIASLPSVAQLKHANFKAALRFERTDNTAHTASVDYLRVTVTYTEPVVNSVTGSVAATSGTAGAASVKRAVAGVVAAMSGAAGAVTITAAPSGSTYPVAGVVAATSAVAGAVNVKRPVAGGVNAASGVAGAVTLKRPVAGVVASVSGVVGAVNLKRPVAGVVAVVSGVSGTVTAGGPATTYPVSGTVAVVSSVAGAINVTRAVAGVVSAGGGAPAGAGILKYWTGSQWVAIWA